MLGLLPLLSRSVGAVFCGRGFRLTLNPLDGGLGSIAEG
ncbi:MAG: hypothetical protein RLZZ511_1777 [Cyanobacteriota bacterium]|jgi:hypothetical protein